MRAARRGPLLQELAEGLGIAPGETTPDGELELHRTHECFGACHRAPMCRVNDEYREDLTPEATQALIAELKAARGTNGRAIATGGAYADDRRESARRENEPEFVKPDYKPILLPDPGRREPVWLEEYRREAATRAGPRRSRR